MLLHGRITVWIILTVVGPYKPALRINLDGCHVPHDLNHLFPFATLQTSIGLESTKKKSSPPSMILAISFRIDSHKPAVFLSAVIELSAEIRLGILLLYSCNL